MVYNHLIDMSGDQYCIRLPGKAARRRSGYTIWRMSKSELKQAIGSDLRWVRKTAGKRQPAKGQYHPTAIARKSAPAPLRAAVREFGACDTALYHGVGRDKPGSKLLGQHCKRVAVYDPYHPDVEVARRPKGSYDEIVSVYTLNVVDRAEGKRILKEIYRRLKPRGHATIVVRQDLCRRR